MGKQKDYAILTMWKPQSGMPPLDMKLLKSSLIDPRTVDTWTETAQLEEHITPEYGKANLPPVI